MKSFILTICLCLCFGAISQSVIGTWLTIDDETKKKKSLVEIFKKDGKVYGKVIKLYRTPSEEQDPICTKCTDDRKDKKVIGMEIIRALSFDADDKKWEKGTIMDPAKGKIYKAKIWVDSEDAKILHVRGYSGPFYRTQMWIKLK